MRDEHDIKTSGRKEREMEEKGKRDVHQTERVIIDFETENAVVKISELNENFMIMIIIIILIIIIEHNALTFGQPCCQHSRKLYLQRKSR